MNPQQIQDLLDRGENLAQRISAAEFTAFQNFAQQVSAGTQSTQDLVDKIDELEKKVYSLEKGFSGIANQIRGSLSALGRNVSDVGRLDKAYRGLSTQVSKLANDEVGIERLSKSQLKTIRARIEAGKDEAEQAAEKLKKGTAAYDALSKAQQDEVDNIIAGNSAFKETLDKLKEREDYQDNYDKALGISGALMNNLGKIGVRAFGGIGISLGSLTDLVEESNEAMHKAADEAAKEAAKSGKNTNSVITRSRVMLAGLGPLAKNLVKALADPLPLLTLLLSGFKEFDKQASNFQRSTGSMMDATAGLNLSIASTVQLMEQLNSIVALTNLNPIDLFTNQELADAAELALLTNMTAEDAAKLNIYSKITGTNLKDNNDQIVRSVNRYNALNKTAVAHGVVQSDIAKTSASTAVSMGLQVDRMVEANASARRLGLTLKDIEQIQKGLLEFESSIEAELEAQLLTGKQINLSRARELALTNQLDKLGDEIFANSADIYEFGRLNYIQQESLASAMGLTRDQLAQIAIQRGLEGEMSKEALANAMNMKAEDLERLEVQQMLTQAIQKMTTAIAPFLYSLSEIIGNAETLTAIFKVLGTVYLIKAIAGIYTFLAGITASAAMAGFLTAGLAVAGGYLAYRTIMSTVDSAVEEAPKPMQDGMIPPGKGRILKGPRGSISFDDKDTIVAGTNLFGGGGSSKEVLAKLDRLIAAVEKGGDVYMDGNKVGQALVLSSYATQ
jgi:hypothetical protein